MLVAKTLPDTVKALLFHARRNVALLGYIIRHSLVDVANALLFHLGFTPRALPCCPLLHASNYPMLLASGLVLLPLLLAS